MFFLNYSLSIDIWVDHSRGLALIFVVSRRKTTMSTKVDYDNDGNTDYTG